MDTAPALDPIVLDPAGRDLHGEAARLRERGPATLVALPGGVVVWSVTSDTLLRRLLRDSRVSKDPQLHWPAFTDGTLPEDWPLRTWVGVRNMFTAYGSDHRRLRTLISGAFTARRVEALRPAVEEITTGLLDDLAATPPGEPADLRERLAYPLPIEVISRLFGVPERLRSDLRETVDGLFSTTITPAAAVANQRRLYGLLGALVAIKRETPAEDMTSGLIAARDDDGSRLSEQELVDTLLLMIGAGHETTVNLIDNAIVSLLTHPGQLAAVSHDPGRWDDVVEEALRAHSPVAHLPLRYAVTDIDCGHNFTIRRGEAILASYIAANRDPERHPDPDRFDIDRADKSHLSFGHGVHFCLGAPLARMEARVALAGLFARFPDIALACGRDELAPLPSFLSNGHREIPVRLRGRDHADTAP